MSKTGQRSSRDKWRPTKIMNMRDLSRDDDFISHLLVEKLGTGAVPLVVHKMDPTRKLPKTEAQKLMQIVRRLVASKKTRQKAIEDAVDELLNQSPVRYYLRDYTQKQINAFATHASRYFELYLPTGSIEIAHTSRYSHRTGKSELCILATRPLNVGTVITELKGSMADLTEEEDKELKRTTDEGAQDGAGPAEGGIGIRRDFSVIHSKQLKKNHLFLGPARFVNHDCDHNVELFREGRYITFRVIKPIGIGEEVTAHYGDGYFGKKNRHCLCQTCERNGRGGYGPETSSDDEEEDVSDDAVGGTTSHSHSRPSRRGRGSIESSSSDEGEQDEDDRAHEREGGVNVNERRTRRGVYAVLAADAKGDDHQTEAGTAAIELDLEADIDMDLDIEADVEVEGEGEMNDSDLTSLPPSRSSAKSPIGHHISRPPHSSVSTSTLASRTTGAETNGLGLMTPDPEPIPSSAGSTPSSRGRTRAREVRSVVSCSSKSNSNSVLHSLLHSTRTQRGRDASVGVSVSSSRPPSRSGASTSRARSNQLNSAVAMNSGKGKGKEVERSVSSARRNQHQHQLVTPPLTTDSSTSASASTPSATNSVRSSSRVRTNTANARAAGTGSGTSQTSRLSTPAAQDLPLSVPHPHSNVQREAANQQQQQRDQSVEGESAASSSRALRPRTGHVSYTYSLLDPSHPNHPLNNPHHPHNQFHAHHSSSLQPYHPQQHPSGISGLGLGGGIGGGIGVDMEAPRGLDGKPLPTCMTCGNVLPVISVDEKVVWGIWASQKTGKRGRPKKEKTVEAECPRCMRHYAIYNVKWPERCWSDGSKAFDISPPRPWRGPLLGQEKEQEQHQQHHQQKEKGKSVDRSRASSTVPTISNSAALRKSTLGKRMREDERDGMGAGASASRGDRETDSAGPAKKKKKQPTGRPRGRPPKTKVGMSAKAQEMLSSSAGGNGLSASSASSRLPAGPTMSTADGRRSGRTRMPSLKLRESEQPPSNTSPSAPPSVCAGSPSGSALGLGTGSGTNSGVALGHGGSRVRISPRKSSSNGVYTHMPSSPLPSSLLSELSTPGGNGHGSTVDDETDVLPVLQVGKSASSGSTSGSGSGSTEEGEEGDSGSSELTLPEESSSSGMTTATSTPTKPTVTAGAGIGTGGPVVVQKIQTPKSLAVATQPRDANGRFGKKASTNGRFQRKLTYGRRFGRYRKKGTGQKKVGGSVSVSPSGSGTGTGTTGAEKNGDGEVASVNPGGEGSGEEVNASASVDVDVVRGRVDEEGEGEMGVGNGSMETVEDSLEVGDILGGDHEVEEEADGEAEEQEQEVMEERVRVKVEEFSLEQMVHLTHTKGYGGAMRFMEEESKDRRAKRLLYPGEDEEIDEASFGMILDEEDEEDEEVDEAPFGMILNDGYEEDYEAFVERTLREDKEGLTLIPPPPSPSVVKLGSSLLSRPNPSAFARRKWGTTENTPEPLPVPLGELHMSTDEDSDLPVTPDDISLPVESACGSDEEVFDNGRDEYGDEYDYDEDAEMDLLGGGAEEDEEEDEEEEGGLHAKSVSYSSTHALPALRKSSHMGWLTGKPSPLNLARRRWAPPAPKSRKMEVITRSEVEEVSGTEASTIAPVSPEKSDGTVRQKDMTSRGLSSVSGVPHHLQSGTGQDAESSRPTTNSPSQGRIIGMRSLPLRTEVIIKIPGRAEPVVRSWSIDEMMPNLESDLVSLNPDYMLIYPPSPPPFGGMILPESSSSSPHMRYLSPPPPDTSLIQNSFWGSLPQLRYPSPSPGLQYPDFGDDGPSSTLHGSVSALRAETRVGASSSKSTSCSSPSQPALTAGSPTRRTMGDGSVSALRAETTAVPSPPPKPAQSKVNVLPSLSGPSPTSGDQGRPMLRNQRGDGRGTVEGPCSSSRASLRVPELNTPTLMPTSFRPRFRGGIFGRPPVSRQTYASPQTSTAWQKEYRSSSEEEYSDDSESASDVEGTASCSVTALRAQVTRDSPQPVDLTDDSERLVERLLTNPESCSTPSLGSGNTTAAPSPASLSLISQTQSSPGLAWKRTVLIPTEETSYLTKSSITFPSKVSTSPTKLVHAGWEADGSSDSDP